MLDLLKHEIQYVALAIMASVYVIKVMWILRFKPMRERTPSKGDERRAITASFFCLFAPWTMESTSKKFHKWVEFVILHIAITIAIGASFIIPEFPGIMANQNVVLLFQALLAAGFVVSIIRFGRRVLSPVNRVISHPDDYFSIFMMLVWFAIAFFAMPNGGSLEAYNDPSNAALMLYMAVTALLIAYVPFSKMSHYIMWPFTRYYFGKHFGHRGTYPKIKG